MCEVYHTVTELRIAVMGTAGPRLTETGQRKMLQATAHSNDTTTNASTQSSLTLALHVC